MRSAFAPVALALAALIAALVRWWLQGSRNFYTAIEKQFYVQDPDTGWVISDDHAIWLGLEVIGVIAAVAVGLAVGGFVIRWRERKTGKQAKLLRVAAWVAAALPLAIPIAAFATGFGPAGARDILPARETKAIVADGKGPAISGSLDAPAGRYEVVPHKSTSIVAQLKAGGDSFDARFSDIKGSWKGDPKDLTKPMTVESSAAVASVDTGIDSRSTHARDGYLQGAKFPTIVWKLDQVVAARQDGADQLAWKAKAVVSLIGIDHRVEVTGTIKKADAAALQRLGLTGAVLLVQGDFSVVIAETAFAKAAGDFDSKDIPIHVSLVLRHTGDI